MVKNSKPLLSTASAFALLLSPAASPLVQPAFSEEDTSDTMAEESENTDMEDDADESAEDSSQLPGVDFENLTEIQVTDETGATSVFTGDVLTDLIDSFEDMPDDFPIDIEGVTSATFTDAEGGSATVTAEELEELIERHLEETASRKAADILQHWDLEQGNFLQVCPREMLVHLPAPLTLEEGAILAE